MAVEKPRPGAEVTQQFRKVTPVVITPQLVACVVGVCRQIVDVLVATAAGGTTLNTQARIQLPAVLLAGAATGNPLAYNGLNGLNLVLSVNDGPDITLTFTGDANTPSSMVAQILDGFVAEGVTEATADTSGSAFLIRTIGTGEFQSIEVRTGTAPTVATTLGLVIGHRYVGKSSYDQRAISTPLSSFPDPRNNLKKIVVEPDAVRVFLGTSETNLREVSRSESLLRRGGGGTAASVLGTVALATAGLYGSAGLLDGLTLSVAIDGAAAIPIAMGATSSAPTNANDLLQKINLALGGVYATNDTNLRLTSRTTGPTSKIVVSGTAAAPLGLLGATATSTGLYGVAVVDDGNGDAVSPLVECVGQNFTASATAAVVVGSVAITGLTYPADLASKTLTLSVAGQDPQTLTFDTAIANAAAVLTAINGFWPNLLIATLNGSNQLSLASVATGEEGSIEVLGGTALATLGLVPSVTGTVPHTALVPNPTVLNTRKLRVDLGGTIVEHTFSGLLSGGTMTDIVANLNANTAFSAVALASVAATNLLRIALKVGGSLAYVQVLAATALDAAPLLGLSPGQRGLFTVFGGNPLPPNSGDLFIVDGIELGRITQRAPGGNVARLRLNKQLPINPAAGSSFYITARNLEVGLPGRPSPDLVVDGNGVPTLKPRLLRDTLGVALATGLMPFFLAYHAIRQDVTAMSGPTPSALILSNLDDIEEQIGPVSVLNPLALGAYLASQNAPGTSITALGVDAVAADTPYGTVEAFVRAFEVLEALEVYAVATLTDEETVAQLNMIHADSMSLPENKGERAALVYMPHPTARPHTTVASGLGNGVGGSGLQIDTGIANLSTLLLNAGVSPVGTLLPSLGVFLDLSSDASKYSIASISGSVVTIRTSFAAGQNDDGFYGTSPMPTVLINEPFAVRVRGASLVLPSGALNRQGMAEAIAVRAEGFANRRVVNIVCDKLKVTLNGFEQLIEGFYGCAIVAGMTAQQPPQQGFTNFPMVAATGVTGTNGFFTEKQLDLIAGGGGYILVQDAAGAPLVSRHQLTTDVSVLEYQEYSILRCLDFASKLIRKCVRNSIGRMNITDTGFADAISQVVQGVIKLLVANRTLVKAEIERIAQDTSARDSLLIDLGVDVPIPCNRIRFTLVI